MSHEATTLPAQPPLRSLPMPERRLSAAEQEPPLWTATRIDVARRLWCKGVAEDDIVAALNRLAGASHGNPQALIALARRLCWPRPQQSLGMLRLTTRDGSPSLAERQAVELAFVNDVVELPMADAAAWGRANGVVRGTNEPDSLLLPRINKARAQWSLPLFRITRAITANPASPPAPVPPLQPERKKPSRRRPA